MDQYLKNQDLNLINSFLHSKRYSFVLENIINYQINKSVPFKILDIGCGHCKIYKYLKQTNLNFQYYGVEPTKDFFDYSFKKYSKNKNFHIFNDLAENIITSYDDIDYYLALESLEHIPERIVYELIQYISNSNFKSFFCSFPNELGPSILIKNFGSFLMGYKRYQEYTIKETLNSLFFRTLKIPPHNTTHRGFDYRVLIHNIYQFMEIKKFQKSPFQFLPIIFSPSIFLECTPSKDNREKNYPMKRKLNANKTL